MICFAKITEWLYEKYIVPEADKSHLLTAGFNEPNPEISLNDTISKNVTEEKVPGIALDHNLSFKFHLKNIFKKVDQQHSALSRISKLTFNPTF